MLLLLLTLLLRLLCLCLMLLSLPAMMLLYAALGAPTTPGTFPILQAEMLHPVEEEKGEIGLTTNLLEPVGDSAG